MTDEVDVVLKRFRELADRASEQAQLPSAPEAPRVLATVNPSDIRALCDRIEQERKEARTASAQCYDCGRQYGDEHGFPDLVIPLEAWESISPTGDEGGLLCPSCICERLHKAGMRDVPAAFMSGPVRSVDSVLMTTYRHVENLRLGRDYSISDRARRLLGIESEQS